MITKKPKDRIVNSTEEEKQKLIILAIIVIDIFNG
jgi:hypothetical protein